VTEGQINTLEDADREDLEGYISYKVLNQVVKKMQNNKRPGSDGFPVEFYSLLEILWNLNSEVCERILWWCTIVTCAKIKFDIILTKSREWRYLKNWEPVIFKTACTAGRMKKSFSQDSSSRSKKVYHWQAYMYWGKY